MSKLLEFVWELCMRLAWYRQSGEFEFEQF